jgi:tetratricopeptide (TPR) repeat protein
MKPMNAKSPLRALLLVLAVTVLAGGLRADTIQLLDGTAIDGVKVTTESWEKVEYRKPKVQAPQSVNAADVKSITYGQTSKDYTAAQELLADGDVVNASRYLDAVASDEALPDTLRATARIEQADLLLSIGQLDLASAAYDQLLASYPNTRHLARALLGKGRTLFFRKQNDEARAALEKLKSEVAEKNLGEQWAMQADFNLLLVLEASKKIEEAAKGYEALRAAAGDRYPEIRSQADLGLARTNLAAQKLDAALPLFEEIIDKRTEAPKDVVAAAFNGRGRVNFEVALAAISRAEKAAAKGDKAKAESERETATEAFASARLDFLRVVTSYPEVIAQQPEALYWAAQCFINIGGPDSDTRARTLLARCAQNYPETDSGKKAAAAK